MTPAAPTPPADDALPWIGAETIRRRVTPARARRALEEVLQRGFDPAEDPPRASPPAGAGHLLLMPSTIDEWVGVKMASVAPANAERGLPRIQAIYLLLDAETLTPRILLDGSVLTELRTPATSALVVDHLARPEAERLLVIGTGPQAIGHARALAEVRDLGRVAIVGRLPERTGAAIRALSTAGVPAVAGDLAEAGEADIIACATSAAEPLFDGAAVRDDACVVAIGSHEPDRRELDSTLMGRSQVVVEEHESAMRECGDIVLAVADGALDPETMVGIAPLVRGEVELAQDRPRVFKGSGMAWQDLAVAIAAVAED